MELHFILDIIVVVCIVALALIGLKTGFVKTVYRFLSMLIAFFIAVNIYPYVSSFLLKTPIADFLRDNISSSVQEGLSGTGVSSMEQAMTRLELPDFVKNWVVESGEVVDNSVASITKALSGAMTEMVLSLLGIFLVFILAFILLILVRALITAVVKLPVLKQLDKGAGFIVGTVTGMLIAYLVCAGIVIFGGAFGQSATKKIDESFVAKYFVKNNYIVSLINKVK